MHANILKRIVIIGPESTGKSTLCSSLAAHYGTAWVKEYAREYLMEHGTSYSFSDLLTVAKGQLAGEDAAAAAMPQGGLLFIDTDMYVMKVWCEFVFDDCHRWILDRIAERHYDLYLLCSTDLPWTKDELREYPDLATRDKLFHIYRDTMVNQQVPWAEVKGSGAARLQCAIDAVEKYCR